ncbi:Uncharacterised protein [Klebsiella variicola]|uniref:Uncharacterized protein n=1 Tax=Klebsiella variicola TaxID=244366 RepID=A0A7H4MPF2_KLEVA|nr:Uncharacterised protein [Klebsiella variicola]
MPDYLILIATLGGMENLRYQRIRYRAADCRLVYRLLEPACRDESMPVIPMK